jgi:hypothetical protein
MYFVVEREIYTKDLAKWMNLSSVDFYVSLGDDIVNVPFSMDCNIPVGQEGDGDEKKKERKEKLAKYLKVEIICSQIFGGLMRDAREAKK